MVAADEKFLRLALRLAQKGFGSTSPNPMVGAVLVKGGQIIGRGWHRKAGFPHAEIEALHDARKRARDTKGSTLYVTLEPCCTHGRTPPCTDAIISAGVKRVVIGTVDPNPKHSGRGLRILRRAGVVVELYGVVGARGTEHEKQGKSLMAKLRTLNESFNHWVVPRTPFVTVKAAMTLDGKIATASGESKWITGEHARAYGMKLRQGSDAILVGINTILKDDPSLTVRTKVEHEKWRTTKPLRRIVLDSMARTPPTAKVVSDEFASLTTIVVGRQAPRRRVAGLAKRANVLVAPTTKKHPPVSRRPTLDLRWLLKKLGGQNITSLLVEGGGEVNASFLFGGYTQRVAFFYAPKIIGGGDSFKAVAGEGVTNLSDAIRLRELEWRKLGEDFLLTALIRVS